MHISMQYTTENEWVLQLYSGRDSIVWYPDGPDGQEVCGGDQCPGSILMPTQLYPEMQIAKHSSEICSRILRMYVKDLYTLKA